MTCHRIAAGVVCVGGPDRIIAVAGVDYRFEDHRVFGPCPVTKTGRERTLGPRHPFWAAVTRWYQTNRMIGADGRCVWTPEPDEAEGMVRTAAGWMSPEMAARVGARVNEKREAKR